MLLALLPSITSQPEAPKTRRRPIYRLPRNERYFTIVLVVSTPPPAAPSRVPAVYSPYSGYF
jgi:hypothetical protein